MTALRLCISAALRFLWPMLTLSFSQALKNLCFSIRPFPCQETSLIPKTSAIIEGNGKTHRTSDHNAYLHSRAATLYHAGH